MHDTAPSPRVLVIEDELLIAMDIECLLSADGFDCVGPAACSRDAIALARAMKPDICLLDINLNDGPTGPIIAEAIGQIDPHATIVFLTANRNCLPAHLYGAFGVISKPFTDDGLVAALRYVRALKQGRRDTLAIPRELELRTPTA